MHPSFKPLTLLLASACSLAALAACTVAPAAVPSGAGTGEVEVRRSARAGVVSSQLLLEAAGAARIVGTATGPAGLVGGNIVSNNSAGIVASNSGRYILAQAAESPIANALVYLTDPAERFYAKDKEPISTTTDSRGDYIIPDGVGVGQVVIVNVILSDNRRVVGFTGTKAGENRIDVSVATTYVTEFLRDRAARAGKKMGDYDLTKLGTLTTLTAQALKASELKVPDLGIGKIADMNHAYALAVGLDRQGLGAAWAELLGTRTVAMTTLAGDGDYGVSGDGGPAALAEFQKPIGLARDATGNIYVVDEGGHSVRRIDAAGRIALFAGSGRPTHEGDGGQAVSGSLNWPRAAAFGPTGELFVADTLNQRIRAINPTSGVIRTAVGAPTVVNGVPLNDFAGDGGPAYDAKLAGARGLAFAPDGTLYIADSWDAGGQSWHHIRRVKPDGVIDTIVGVDGVHGFNGDGKAGRETQVNFVNQLACDATGNLYFADTRNHRVRRWDATTGLVSTVAGTGTDGGAGNGGLATAAQLSSPYGLALDTQTTPPTLFIGERGGRRIRVVDAEGKIRTVGGGGERTTDGEATGMALNEPIDLLLEPSGNLLVADSRGAKVRRLWLQWGY